MKICKAKRKVEASTSVQSMAFLAVAELLLKKLSSTKKIHTVTCHQKFETVTHQYKLETQEKLMTSRK